MPIFLFWGEDDFAMQRAIANLRDRTLDPDWSSFNYDKIPPEQSDSVIQALNQAMTPPFGMGSRLVWLSDTSLCQRCPEDLLAELDRTLPVIPEETVLLFSSPTKPDGRIRSTKLLQKHAEIREFSPLSPWQDKEILRQTQNAAEELGIKLTTAAAKQLAESVGNNTRQLYSELEKLRLYHGNTTQPIGAEAVKALVLPTTQNSLKLADAILQRNTVEAIALTADLFAQNEAALRIVATLVNRFRMWLWVKLLVESGERDDRAIAQASELGNPGRVYYAKQEVRSVSLAHLQHCLPKLLELEFDLKQGADDLITLQTRIIELCNLPE